ncbi:F-box protein At5g49610 [Cajanus cajan]|uniref:F-box protein At4g12560 family n=1 Tax=Cajanus cajan TaxID=3821 RepID=A0A151T0S5_CAJCA|nr:F-box protein At5g49610 [Cajanus cajan]XP_020222625.1 F-box protein At5g49610 [Cajanus cajan]XP_020222626.1 F-box protein At5g49610 [Cajanus cajan]XP_029128475.1 F-box protein At5g49610 [Cajanus cajan]KYP60662.1 F-box protein At4g12560 family [Cajanus cajan]
MSDNLFPDEILVEILKRLPTKSLVRFTSVCKSWRSLITDPSFISIHHRHSPSSLLLHSGNHLTLPHRRHSSALLLPSFPHRDSPVVAFSNALICIAYGEQCQPLIICNPSVRRYVTLPAPSHYPCHHFSYIAFDSSKCDYKVVRISCMVDDQSFGLSAPQVELYSLATGFWRTLHSIAPVCYIAGDAPHGFHDGLVHWIAKRCVSHGWYFFVLSFCFEDELFREIELPESLASVSWDNPVTVKVVGGGNGKTLSVYHVSAGSPCSCDIWVMKEYGVVESWNKVFGFVMSGFCLEAPALGMMLTDVAVPPLALYVTNGGEVLLLMYVAGKRCLFSLDMERKSFKDLQIEVGTDYVYCGHYSESLVLLNKASGLVSY